MKQPTLYILMRNDLDSMTCGKGHAQSAHASNAFVHRISRVNKQHPIWKGYLKWARETHQGFGTTLTLAGAIPDFEKALEHVEHDGGIGVRQDNEVAFGTIHDPTYPLRDGEFTHLIPLDTCMWCFCDREIGRALFINFPLHP